MEDAEGDQVDPDEPLHVEVYATHDQMESSQHTLEYSPLDRDVRQDASNLLDVGMDSDLDESVDKAEPEDCTTAVADLYSWLGLTQEKTAAALRKADFTRRFWDATHPPTPDSPPK